MEVSKIQLSEAELNLVCDAEVILTKNRIIGKAITLLEMVQDDLTISKEGLNQEQMQWFMVSPKISRGENYLGLPYVVLDYPRYSRKEDLLFTRLMFWWGHHFSCTLQAGGGIKSRLVQPLADHYDLLAGGGFYAGINSDPWQHHFGDLNYRRVSEFSLKGFKALLEEQPHIKIATRWPLTAWAAAGHGMIESWKVFKELVAEAV